jgi:hypothetical protein
MVEYNLSYKLIILGAIKHAFFLLFPQQEDRMVGGGILALVAYGAQNVLLSGNPQMTYWYKTFRRYSHFAMENVSKTLDGPNELFFDREIYLHTKIDRVGDLLSDIYFSFRLPDIFSKYATPVPGSRTSQFMFNWVRYVGAALIKNVAFCVGGQKIQEFDGTYLVARALADYSADEYEKWRTLVGDAEELTDPANGIWAGGPNRLSYPSVFQDKTVATQVNRPSIFGQDIHIPLGFWFSEHSSKALPLVGLQYHDCEVQVTLNPIQKLYTILDISGYRVAPGYRLVASTTAIEANSPDYGTLSSDLSGEIRNFLTDVGVSLPINNNLPFNPRLQCTYIYLNSDDQKVFATSPLSYLISQVTPYSFSGLYKREQLDLKTHNPVTRLLFVPRRSDWQFRNNFANFTNWANFPFPPFAATQGLSMANANLTSGRLVTTGQLNIIRSIRVLANGNEIQEEKPIDYFTKITPWKNLSGNPRGLLPVYSFSLHSPGTQPSGSINTSRITNFQVEVDVYPLPINTTYTYDLTIYVENLNFFEIASGMGGLKYAL